MKKVIASISGDVASLRASWSRLEDTRERLSKFDSVIGDEQFDFDDAVINSEAYRRTFHKHQDYDGPAGNAMCSTAKTNGRQPKWDLGDFSDQCKPSSFVDGIQTGS